MIIVSSAVTHTALASEHSNSDAYQVIGEGCRRAKKLVNRDTDDPIEDEEFNFEEFEEPDFERDLQLRNEEKLTLIGEE